MALHMPATNLESNGVVFTFDINSMDNLLVVRDGIAVNSLSDRAIVITDRPAVVVIDGIVQSGRYTAIFADYATIDIGPTGRVYSLGEAAGFIGFGAALNLGRDATVTNAGSIASGRGNGVSISSIDCTLSNSGRIEGLNGGVLTGSYAENFSLENSGRIIAGPSALTQNIAGHAVQLSGLNQSVTNSGLILAKGATKAGIHLGDTFDYGNPGEGFSTFYSAQNARITNTGTIASDRFWGVDAGDNLAFGFALSNAGTIKGGAAAGAVRGSAGVDAITNSGTIGTGLPATGGFATLELGAGNDRLVNSGMILGFAAMGDNDDSYDGRLSTAACAVYGGNGVDFLYGGAADDALYGGGDGDELRGRNGDDYLEAGLGNDTVYGGADDDILYGLEGTDQLFGGTGDDRMIGGASSDLYHVDSTSDEITELSNQGNDRVQSSKLSLILASYANVENATLTGRSALNITGTEGSNSLIGNAAANRIEGRGGADQMTGDAGADTLSGGSGDDALRGGDDADSLSGGTGADDFVFASAAEADGDVITDFVAASDDIVLTGVMAGGSFVGAAAFTAAGQVRYVAATGVLEGNVTGTDTAEWTLTISNKPVLSAGDFVF